jgi:hypothetical protein
LGGKAVLMEGSLGGDARADLSLFERWVFEVTCGYGHEVTGDFIRSEIGITRYPDRILFGTGGR